MSLPEFSIANLPLGAYVVDGVVRRGTQVLGVIGTSGNNLGYYDALRYSALLRAPILPGVDPSARAAAIQVLAFGDDPQGTFKPASAPSQSATPWLLGAAALAGLAWWLA